MKNSFKKKTKTFLVFLRKIKHKLKREYLIFLFKNIQRYRFKMPQKEIIRKIGSHKISNLRSFSGSRYITDFTVFQTRLEAKSTVLFLKSKYIGVKARVIDKTDFYIVYYDKLSYDQIKFGKIIIPDFKDIPIDIIEMVKSKRKQKITKLNSVNVQKVMEISSNYKNGKNQTYQVVKFDDNATKIDPIQSTSEILTPKEDEISDEQDFADETEVGINAALDHVENEFFKSCPKCGEKMYPTFIVLGPKGRMSVYQCKLCKFYLPRSLKF